MAWALRYMVSLLPLALIGGAILLAEWAFEAFNCSARGKELFPCFAHGMDITPLLGLALFWCKLLLPVAWVISVPWVIYVAISHVQAIRNKKRDWPRLMKFSPAGDFRPYRARFTVSLAFSAVVGAVGVGVLLYFGIVVLIALLGSIATTRDPKKRVTLWGALFGLAVGFFGMWAYLGATHQLRF